MTHLARTVGIDSTPFRTEEEQQFWRALVDLAAMENASQAAMAAFVGVSQGYVSKILAGKQIPKPTLRRRFAAFFKLSYEDMTALGRERLESADYQNDTPPPPQLSSARASVRWQRRQPGPSRLALYLAGYSSPGSAPALLYGSAPA